MDLCPKVVTCKETKNKREGWKTETWKKIGTLQTIKEREKRKGEEEDMPWRGS